MNSQVSFLEGELSLIHIPLDLYSVFLQPILRVLLPQQQSLYPEAYGSEGLTPEHKHGFLNISVTPIECSIVCHTSWVRSFFEPVTRALHRDESKRVSVSRDSYVALCVISAGMDAGSRVVDLSSPLALAGIPIFFITTYYSDFILVPTKSQGSVVHALLARGFEVAENESSFVAPAPPRRLSHSQQYGYGHGHVHNHSRGGSSSSGDQPPPPTPPPVNAADLQDRTFELLRKRRVEPYVDPQLHLIHCSGRENSRFTSGEIFSSLSLSHRPSLSRINGGGGGIGGANGGGGGGVGGGGGGGGGGTNGGGGPSVTWADTVDTRLYACLVAALAGQPRFLSVTLAQDDPPSLLLDRDLLSVFGDSLIGDTEGDLVPIFLDLATFPFEATGIVSGVAGKLVQEMLSDAPELSYLSTARAGAVILSREQSVKAVEILKPLLSRE